MTFRRPAIQRIALIFGIATVVAVAAPSARADSLFGEDAMGTALPSDRSASQAARQELAMARRMLTRAQMAASRVEVAVEKQLRAASGYSSLQIDAAQAISQYYAARRPTMATLSRDAEYTELSRQREVLRAEIRRVADRKLTDYERIVPLAKQALVRGERMTRSESILLALDPAVEDARGAMTQAFATLRRVAMTARARAKEFPAVTMAREDVTQARERVSVANANLVAALRAEVAAYRTRDRRNGRSRGA